MAGLRFLGFQLRDIQRDLGLPDGWVVAFRLRHPGIDVTGHQGRQGQRLRQGLGLGVNLAHQLIERKLLDPQIVFGRDFLRCPQVKAGLCLAGVGDGGGADFEVALGRRQLLAHGGFLGFDEGQAVHGRQDVKVSLADTHDQVLVGRSELCLGQIDLLHSLLVTRPVGRTVQRL